MCVLFKPKFIVFHLNNLSNQDVPLNINLSNLNNQILKVK
jgi:hypothetical protein